MTGGFTVNEAVRWTDVLQAIGSMTSAIVPIVGFILVWRQISLTNETLKQNNQTSIHTLSADIYKYLADNSHLRPYLYDSRDSESQDPTTQQLLVFCEVLCDFFEFVVVKQHTLDQSFVDPWKLYMRRIYRNSPVFRRYFEETKEQYSAALRSILLSAAKH
jgi:hypothetical protein